MKSSNTWTFFKSALIVLPESFDTSKELPADFWALVEYQRHAKCRRFRQHALALVAALAAMNMLLCAVIWFALPACD